MENLNKLGVQELNKLGVQELSTEEMMNIEGGLGEIWKFIFGAIGGILIGVIAFH